MASTATQAPKVRTVRKAAAKKRAKAGPARDTAARSRTRVHALTDLRRGEIVQAAVKLFSRRGYEATRAEDIAQAAKIAKGTLYLYFRSKEAIYSAAIAFAVRELQLLATERVAAAQGFREKLSVAIAVRMHFWTAHELLYRLLVTLGREARHRRQTNELLRSGQAHFEALFTEASQAGELVPGEYTALAWAVLDMIRGATERRMDRLSETTVEADAQSITAFALRAAGLVDQAAYGSSSVAGGTKHVVQPNRQLA